MCARLLACPLCSQPGFLSLDSLRAGLVSVATRPLACPVCNEVLLGIDKLTIHLFGHTIAAENVPVSGEKLHTVIRNDWSLNKENVTGKSITADIYIPIDEVHTFSGSNATQIQSIHTEVEESNQVIVLQSVDPQSDIFTSNLINQNDGDRHGTVSSNIFEDTITTINKASEPSTPMDQTCKETNFNEVSANDLNNQDDMELSSINNHNNDTERDESFSQSWSENNQSSEEPSKSAKFIASHTDRLAELVKSSQIASSPLGTFHDSFDCSRPKSPDEPSASSKSKPQIKSSRTLLPSERTERCNICGLLFLDRKILLLHKQFVHKIKEKDSNLAPEDLMKNFPCHLCTKVFKMRGSLMVHMRVAHPGFNMNSKPYESVKQAIKLRVQQSMLNPKEQTPEQAKEIAEKLLNFELEEGYNCPTCGKNFKKEQHVIQHIKTHEGKQWECDICSKMFTTKYFLKKHKRLHSGEMPYKCNLCDKTFTFQQSYHKHRMYHKDEKPHTCQTCGRSFKELSTLHNHERIHTGEKPFACESCGKCFRQRVSYLVHQRIHTGAMPYNCVTCGRSFRYKVSQRTHKCSQQSTETMEQQPENVQNSVKNAEESAVQNNHDINTSTSSEENQYVFVLNDKGEHVLKKKSEIENSVEFNEKNEGDSNKNESMTNTSDQNSMNELKCKENSSDSNDLLSTIMKDSTAWNQMSDKNNSQLSEAIISKQFSEKELRNEFSNSIWERSRNNDLSCQKLFNENHSTNEHDIFSMIMSPMGNEVSSPSAEMKDLRLSSPVNNQEGVNNFFPKSNTNAVQMNLNNSQNDFNDGSISFSALQNINEDSLKELLNSISDK